MNISERIAMLKEAQCLIREAADLIHEAVDGTTACNTADAYLIPVLDMAIDNDNDWLGNNPGDIETLIGYLKEGDDNDPGPEDEIEDMQETEAPDIPGMMADAHRQINEAAQQEQAS